MGNLNAWRATDPKRLPVDPLTAVGHRNQEALRWMVRVDAHGHVGRERIPMTPEERETLIAELENRAAWCSKIRDMKVCYEQEWAPAKWCNGCLSMRAAVALRGARLPETPRMRTCGWCKGTGAVWQNYDEYGMSDPKQVPCSSCARDARLVKTDEQL